MGMSTTKKKTHRLPAGPGSSKPDKDRTEVHGTEDSSEDNCRCREVSEKTVPDLFKLMISDLAIWKKKGRK
jgi:hypothetical protein